MRENAARQTSHDFDWVEIGLTTCVQVEQLLSVPDQSVQVHW